MDSYRVIPLLLLLAIPACFATDPVPREDWAVPDDPLYRTAVWVQRDGLWPGGGVVVESDSPGETFVLTAFHVLRGGSRIEVGVFRHNRIDGKGPEWSRHEAEIVAGGYALDEAFIEPIRELAAAHRALLDAVGEPGAVPLLDAQSEAFSRAIRQIEGALEREEAMDGLAALRDAVDVGREEFGAAMVEAANLISARRGAEEGIAATQRVFDAMRELARAYALYNAEDVGGYDVAILRVRAPARLHASRCMFASADEVAGAPAQAVTIWPDGQPRVRPGRIGGSSSFEGSSEMRSLGREGNSGSPVFVDGRLAGIITMGLFDAEESPPDVFLELVFLRIGTVRVWLERNGLEGILDDRG